MNRAGISESRGKQNGRNLFWQGIVGVPSGEGYTAQPGPTLLVTKPAESRPFPCKAGRRAASHPCRFCMRPGGAAATREPGGNHPSASGFFGPVSARALELELPRAARGRSNASPRPRAPEAPRARGARSGACHARSNRLLCAAGSLGPSTPRCFAPQAATVRVESCSLRGAILPGPTTSTSAAFLASCSRTLQWCAAHAVTWSNAASVCRAARVLCDALLFADRLAVGMGADV